MKSTLIAVILAFIFFGFINLTSNLLYQPQTNYKRGYKIPIDQSLRQKITPLSQNTNTNDQKQEELDIDFKNLIANADVKKGEKIFKKCSACHQISSNNKHSIGPNLYQIINRQKAIFSANYKYSQGLLDKGGIWDYASLNQLLIKPSSYIKGTKMSFAGLGKQKDRINVIAYIKDQSNQ